MLLPYPSLRQGLVGAWCPSLGASGLTLIDRSGRNGHGTLTNMGGQDNWRASGSGVALNFDGTNDVVVGPDLTGLAGNVPWTFAAWILSTATQGTLVSCGGGGPGLLVRLSTSGNMIYSGGPTGCTATGMFDSGRWTHVAFSYPGTVIRDTIAYKNGVSRGAVIESPVNAANVAANFTRQSMWLGANVTSTFLNGQLDDIRIYSRALTPAEIRLLASRRGIGLSPSALLHDDDSESVQYPIANPPNRVHANVDGVWVPGQVRANSSGTWGNAETLVNQGGVWQ